MSDEEYYLRDLTASDWPAFKAIDEESFGEDSTAEQSFLRGLSSPKGLSIVMINKETKEFMGYYRILLYGTLGHIQRVGVAPKFQGKGYGTILLESAMGNLEKAGARKFMLYVLIENETAINLYKKHHFDIEYTGWQFDVPLKALPKEPRGNCRHLDWGEIQLMSLRFGLNPHRIQYYFGLESQHVLVYEINRQQTGVCRFNPDYPGAFPFKLKDREYFLDFIAHLTKYMTNKEFKSVKITIDNQQELIDLFQEKKIPLKRKLYRMSRVVDLE